MSGKLSRFSDLPFFSGGARQPKRNHQLDEARPIFEAKMAREISQLREAARIAVETSLRVKEGEQVLIITNPAADVAAIAEALYDASLDAGGRPVLVFQPLKVQFDFAEPAVLAAFGAKPEVVISLSAGKLGKDPKGIASPYEYEGLKYDHIFHLQRRGEKSCRSFWSPSTTVDSFVRTVPIDYAELKRRCAAIAGALDRAVSVHVRAPGGTDITIGLRGRKAKSDDGDFSLGGSGGNLPAGETFISPQNGTARGRISFDGSISVNGGDIIIREPIDCVVEKGFVKEIHGAGEAGRLRASIEAAETGAREFEKTGKLPAGAGEIYARNARNIGELGIGLNPRARITGNMLEDEKAFRTCHFAIGMNYDEDAPCLIHLDGLVKNPTITVTFDDGIEQVIENEGELAREFE
ncbi:MAG: aminopeptidase [Treponema sp.]|jgi:leucyl aminopeptidase (aminopeptidase T)|nr:aminopeptidase [Treponema sp.]